MSEPEKPGRAWRGRSVNHNAARNKAVKKAMTEFEALSHGVTMEEFVADMQAQRLRVLRKAGVTPTEEMT